MDNSEDALKAVNAAIAKCKVRERKRLAETSGHVSTHLVLLKLSNITKQLSDKLATFLRDSFGVFYIAVPTPALKLAAAIFESVYHNHILSAIGGAQSDQKGLWESVLHELLSGVLDFSDAHNTKAAKDAIGESLFSVLCDVCFSLTAPKTGVDLRCTAYNILIDAAASHPGNQILLRDPKVLGGERLGSCIWRTKDYLALESLLNLFARALPSTNNSVSGRAKRTVFIHSVFKSTAPPESTAIADGVSEILENVPSSDWEETSVRIVDEFARGNISYPQPLAVNELIVNDEKYPSDRLYVDEKTFLANVLLEEDQYETLEIAFASIDRIRIDRATEGRMRVTLDLSMPPRLGKDLIKLKSNYDVTRGLKATFLLRTEQLGRILHVLNNRGLDPLVSYTRELPSPKLSLAIEPANLEIDSAGRLVELSQSERIENVSQFYRTDDPSDDIQSAEDFDEFVVAVEVNAQPISPFATEPRGNRRITEGDKLAPLTTSVSPSNTIGKAGMTSVGATSKSTALGRTTSQLNRDAVFGGDLSDISTEFDSPTPRSNMLRRNSTSTSAKLVRGRLSFEPVSAAKDVGRVGHGRVGKIILDSDEDFPAALTTKSRPRPANRTLLREPTADDIPVDVPTGPPASLAPIPLEPPATPPSQEENKSRLAALSLGLQSGSGKVLRFSNVIPAPDFNAALSSPVIVPKGVLKSALVKKPPAPVATLDTLVDSSPPRGPPAPKPAAGPAAILKPHNPLYDLIPPSSSPTPGAKRSVKGALRKKDEPVSIAKAAKKDSITSAPVPVKKPVKRKALAEVETDKNVPPTAVDNESPRPAKRARTSATTHALAAPTLSGLDDVKPKLDTDMDAQVLRPAMRARKKYHARKGRTSSPLDGSDTGSKTLLVDYDALPSPPRAGTGAAAATPSSVRSTPPRPAKAKAADTKATEAEKNSKARRGKADALRMADKVENVEKMVKTVKLNAEKATRTKKAEKPGKIVKMEKTIPAGEPEEKKTGQAESVPQVDKSDEPVATAPSRAPPRPRRVGAGSAKDKAKESAKDTAKEVETKPGSSTDRPVRTSVRAATAAEKRRAQEEKERSAIENHVGHTSPVATHGDDVLTDALPEQPLVADTLLPESDIAGLTQAVASGKKTQTALVPPRSNGTEGGDSAIKKSKKAPWDILAEQIALDDAAAIIDDDLADVSFVLGADITLVQSSSPVAVHKKVMSTSPQLEVRSIVSTKQTSEPRSGGKVRDPSALPPVPKVNSKPSPIVIRREVETIDLTLDSPPKAPRRRPSPKVIPAGPPRRSPRLVSPSVQPLPILEEDTAEGTVEPDAVRAEQYLPKRLPKPTVRPTVRFVSESLQSAHDAGEDRFEHVQRPPAPQVTKPSLPFSMKKAARRKQEMALEEAAAEGKRPASPCSDDACMERIVEVLGDLHELVVRSVKNRFEGVREEVRMGRDELLRCAADDLHEIRADSVAHFNKLVDLEAEYATVGRNIKRGTEDWKRVNEEICREVSAAIERHDRSMLSKKMPTTLVSVQP